MSRHVPTTDEQKAIDLLTLAGYHVMRHRSHLRLLERVRVAEIRAEIAKEEAEHAREWAYAQIAEHRRLSDRLTRVAAASTALGVTLTDINEALVE